MHFRVFCLLFLLFSGLYVYFHTPAAYEWFQCEDAWDDPFELILAAVACAGGGGLLLFFRRLQVNHWAGSLMLIDGELPNRLQDGSLRLMRVSWLLERPADWVLQRRQDLPEDAFWSPDDAVDLFFHRRMAALSYKWQGPFNSSKGGGDQPDGNRFHLNEVLAYYREGKHAQERPALLWDFAALPQHHPVTGEKRTEEENRIFKAGLGVMTNAYSSPDVLVLQHTRIPAELERELNQSFGGKPPPDRLDLIPYAGKHCRSGWCTSESACALLMTVQGGHVYELGVGKAPVIVGRRPSVQVMESLFQHESTRFIGRADRDVVCDGYLTLREDLERYEQSRYPFIFRLFDALMTGGGEVTQTKDCYRFMRGLRVCLLAVSLVFVALTISSMVDGTPADIIGNILRAITPLAAFSLPSRIVRAHLAAILGYRTHDSLDYTFHCSVVKPPFRKRVERADECDGGELVVPNCFLPEDGSPNVAVASRGSAEHQAFTELNRECLVV